MHKNKLRLGINILSVLGLITVCASLANAQATRTWVSGVGDDVNPCSRTAPCKTFAGAISKTAPCGEIDTLDSAGFGAVTITKSITIDGTASLSSVLGAGTNGVVINAAGSDVITLRGLSINGACTGTTGISVLSAKTVNVEDCVVFRFTTGISASDGDGAGLNIRNTVVRDNSGDGLVTSSAGGSLKTTLQNSSFTGNGTGVHARGGSIVSARRCVFSSNSANAIFIDANIGGTVSTVRIWESQLSQNGAQGIQAGNGGNSGTSRAEIAQDQITNNTGMGVNVSGGGIVETFGNNTIVANLGGDGCVGCTPVGPGN